MSNSLSRQGVINSILAVKSSSNAGLSWRRPSAGFLATRVRAELWAPTIKLSDSQSARMTAGPYVELDIHKDPVFFLLGSNHTDLQHLSVLGFIPARQEFIHACNLNDPTCSWLNFIQGFDLAEAMVNYPYVPVRSDVSLILQRIVKPAPSA